jgi:hypothetical protein
VVFYDYDPQALSHQDIMTDEACFWVVGGGAEFIVEEHFILDIESVVNGDALPSSTLALEKKPNLPCLQGFPSALARLPEEKYVGG